MKNLDKRARLLLYILMWLCACIPVLGEDPEYDSFAGMYINTRSGVPENGKKVIYYDDAPSTIKEEFYLVDGFGNGPLIKYRRDGSKIIEIELADRLHVGRIESPLRLQDWLAKPRKGIYADMFTIVNLSVDDEEITVDAEPLTYLSYESGEPVTDGDIYLKERREQYILYKHGTFKKGKLVRSYVAIYEGTAAEAFEYQGAYVLNVEELTEREYIDDNIFNARIKRVTYGGDLLTQFTIRLTTSGYIMTRADGSEQVIYAQNPKFVRLKIYENDDVVKEITDLSTYMEYRNTDRQTWLLLTPEESNQHIYRRSYKRWFDNIAEAKENRPVETDTKDTINIDAATDSFLQKYQVETFE